MRKTLLIPALCLAASAACDSSPPAGPGGEAAGASSTAEDVAGRVRKVVVRQLGVDSARVTPEARFLDDLGADSLDLVELIMALEQEFGVPIPDEAAERMVTVGDAIAHLEAGKS